MKKKLKYLMKNISGNLLETKSLVEILDEISDFDAKGSTLVYMIKDNIKKSFKDIERCREQFWQLTNSL